MASSSPLSVRRGLRSGCAFHHELGSNTAPCKICASIHTNFSENTKAQTPSSAGYTVPSRPYTGIHQSLDSTDITRVGLRELKASLSALQSSHQEVERVQARKKCRYLVPNSIPAVGCWDPVTLHLGNRPLRDKENESPLPGALLRCPGGDGWHARPEPRLSPAAVQL